MSSIPARYLICIALCACSIACSITAGCSGLSGQPEIGSDLSGDLVVHFIDVGQGDSILIEFRDKTMLIDAGERGMGERVIAYLEERNVERLDVVVATHAHSDHIGGLADVISAYPVGRFVDAAQPHPTATYENLLVLVEDRGIPYTAAERGQEIALDPDLEILILNPGAKPLGDINEDSVVLKMTYGEISYLFTGDAGNPAEESMIEAGLDLDADVLKVGHHASRYASSAEFLSASAPRSASSRSARGTTTATPTRKRSNASRRPARASTGPTLTGPSSSPPTARRSPLPPAGRLPPP